MHSKRRWLGLMPLALLVCGLPVMARGALQPVVLQDRNTELKAISLTKEMPQGRSQYSGSSGSKQAVLQQDSLLQVEGSLSEGDITLNDGSLYDEHTFQGQAGQIVRITLESDAFDTYLLLIAPSGDPISENDDGGSGNNAEIVVQLPDDGPYRVLATAYDQTGGGAYRLMVIAADAEALRQAEQQAEADRLLQQGINQYRFSKFREALGSLREALGSLREAREFFYRSTGHPQGEAITLGNVGAADGILGDYRQVIDYLEQHLAIARDIGDRQGEVNALGNLGAAYWRLGDYGQAIDYLEQHLAIARDIGDRQGEANALGNLAYALESQFQPELAIIFFKQAVNTYETIRDSHSGLEADLQQSYTATMKTLIVTWPTYSCSKTAFWKLSECWICSKCKNWTPIYEASGATLIQKLVSPCGQMSRPF